jgi:nucleic acid/nucleotide deaminase of polymorphic system toxin
LLVRLRSKHAPPSRRTKGPPIIIQLQKFSEMINLGKKRTQRFQPLQEVVLNLSKDFDALEKLSETEANSTSGCMILKEILLKTSSLSFSKLIEFLSTVPPKDSPWSNTPYIRVVRKFQKLAQYVFAERHLRYMIRKVPNWQIREANDGPYTEHPDGAEPDDAIGLFTRMLTKSTAKQRKKFVRNLETRIGKNRGAIEQRINELISLENRVHAEIQLLYHYEQDQQVKLRPRILCSNKEACYLCNLYISTHAKFHTQRSHGNLYPKWRLPRFDELQLSKNAEREMKQVIARFSHTIEMQILSYLLQQPQRRQDPSESSVFLPGVYTPSIVSVPGENNLVVVDEASAGPESHHRRVDSGAAFLQPVQPAVMNPGISSFVAEPEEPESSIHHPLPSSESSSSSSLLLSNQPDPTTWGNPAYTELALGEEPYLLSRGTAIEIKICKGSSARFHTPVIHCEFEYDATSSKKKATTADHAAVILRVEWLSADATSLGNGLTQIVDVTAPSLEIDEVSVDGIFEEHGLVISGKGCSVMMRAVRRPALRATP